MSCCTYMDTRYISIFLHIPPQTQGGVGSRQSLSRFDVNVATQSDLVPRSRFCCCEGHSFQLALLGVIVDVGELVELMMALVAGQQDQKQNKEGLDVVKR